MGFITLAFLEPTLLMQKIGPNGPGLSGLKKNYYSSKCHSVAKLFSGFSRGRILIERMGAYKAAVPRRLYFPALQ